MALINIGELDKQLHDAVGKNDIESASLLLDQGANVNTRGGRWGFTVLMTASRNGNKAMSDLLLLNGATVDETETFGDTALIFAAEGGNEETVETLLQKNPDIQKKGYWGMTAIHHAARSNHPAIINQLVSCGAIVDLEDDRGETPLWHAACHGHMNCVDVLVSAGANPHHKSKQRGSPLDIARQKGLNEVFQRLNDVAKLAEKSTMEANMAAMWRQLETLQIAYGEERREKEALRHARDEERRAKTIIAQDKARLQSEFDEQQGQKRRLEQQVQSLTEHREELLEQLTISRAATDEIRELLRQNQEVLTIPSRDIRLTGQKLGGGSYGEVCVAYWQGCPVAVKMLYEVLADSLHNIQLLLQEVSIGWKVHHPNIAGVCGVTLELQDEKKTAWIVMELLQGSMAGVIDAARKAATPLTIREKVDMAHDSVCGLNYLHSLTRLVLHGDIRPTNILVNTVMRAKLGDLGAARFSDATRSVGLVSPDYSAPERMDGRSVQKSNTTDVYSMGVTLCELFTCLPPNRSTRMSQIQLIQQINVGNLCNRMVARDPGRRPSTGEALSVIGRVRETHQYKESPPRRMVKGKMDGVDDITLTDRMW